MRVTRFGPMGASVVVLDDEGRTGDLHVVEKKCVVKLVNNIHSHAHLYTVCTYMHTLSICIIYMRCIIVFM